MGADNQQERPLDPWYVTGFVDAEGCFSVSVRPHPNVEEPTRWLMAPVFQSYQHRDGLRILEDLKEFFGCGTLVPKGPNSNVITFSVHGLDNLSTRVLPHFRRYPLQTYKAIEYEKFCEIVRGMRAGEHRNPEGFSTLGANRLLHEPARKESQVHAGASRERNPQRPYAGHAKPRRVKIWSDLHGDMQLTRMPKVAKFLVG